MQDVAAGKCWFEPIPELQEHYALCQEVAAAADERDAQIKAISDRLGYDEAEERWAALGEAACDAEWAVMNTPAPDLPELLWKLEKLLEVETDGCTASWASHAVEQTMADARRLLGRT